MPRLFERDTLPGSTRGDLAAVLAALPAVPSDDARAQLEAAWSSIDALIGSIGAAYEDQPSSELLYRPTTSPPSLIWIGTRVLVVDGHAVTNQWKVVADVADPTLTLGALQGLLASALAELRA